MSVSFKKYGKQVASIIANSRRMSSPVFTSTLRPMPFSDPFHDRIVHKVSRILNDEMKAITNL
jgi:hypothetical protein